MISLEEYNTERLAAYNRVMAMSRPHANGIACPACGEELWDSNPTARLASHPPQRHVHCPACEYRGYRLA